jgi:hypothetical protein
LFTGAAACLSASPLIVLSISHRLLVVALLLLPSLYQSPSPARTFVFLSFFDLNIPIPSAAL